jgi:hypothetical protein
LSDKWALIKDDPRLRFRLLLPLGEESPGAYDLIRAKLPVKTISLFWAYLVPWDLMIMADHCLQLSELVDGNGVPPVRFCHGIPSKRVNGENYAFGARAYTSQARMRYKRIFVGSQAIKEFAVKLDPAFEPIVSVVGSLEEDRLLAQVGQREYFRQQLGISQGEVVVLVTSTWGPYCLMEQMGDSLLAQAQKLKSKFKFIFSVHPLEYRPKANGERVWGQYLSSQPSQGFMVRDPSEDWIPYMLACDILLTDHTSLASRGAVLERPMVYVPVPDEVIDPGGIIWQLRDISPQIKHNASDLADCLATVRETYPYDKLKLIAEKMNSYPKQAAQRIKQEIYPLLEIEPFS